MTDTQTAASLVEVANNVGKQRDSGELYGAELDQIWFFLRRRPELFVFRERDDIYLILEALGFDQAIRMTSYLAEHADSSALGIFWKGAHQHTLEMRTAAEQLV